MNPEMYIVLSGALTFGVPLTLAVRELVLLRRGDGGGGSWTRDAAPETPPAPCLGGDKPLPDCLIPKIQPHCVSRSRVLEDA